MEERKIFKVLQGRINEFNSKKSLSVNSYNYFTGKKTQEIQLTNNNSGYLNKSQNSHFAEKYETSDINDNNASQTNVSFHKTQRNNHTATLQDSKNLKKDFEKIQLNTERIPKTADSLVQREKNMQGTKSQLNLTSYKKMKKGSPDFVDNEHFRHARAPYETTANFLSRQRRNKFLHENTGFKYLPDDRFYDNGDKEIQFYPTCTSDFRISKGKIKKILAGTKVKDCVSDPRDHTKIKKGLGNI